MPCFLPSGPHLLQRCCAALRIRDVVDPAGRQLGGAGGVFLGGALGNGLDRFLRGPAPLHGGVVDWLSLNSGGASMNLADLSLNAAVLILIARGRSNKVIALELGVAEKTVKTHVSHILGKLGLTDRTQPALYAVRQGLV